MDLNGIIVKGLGGLYEVKTEKGLYSGRARGKFRLQNIKPTCGDYVKVSILSEEEKECSVDEILERKNILVRPPVANIDQVFIVFAVKSPNPNLDLLDKFILVCEDNNLEVTICLNKVDLLTDEDKFSIKKLYENIGYKVIMVSTYEEVGLAEIKEELLNKVSVFAGPSGVGKSSIVNKLFPKAKMETGGLSQKIQRGKHTTRHVELIEIHENTFLVDSPGFTSLSVEYIEKEDLEQLFREFRPFLNQCKFNDCIHIKEKHCAVKDQIGISIDESRHKRYVTLYEEKVDKDNFRLKK